MLEICLSSLIWSLNLNSCNALKIYNSTVSTPMKLSQARPYESDYSREAEQERQRRDVWQHGDESSDPETKDPDYYRIHRGNDDYHREVEYERDGLEREPDNEPHSEDEADYYRRDTDDESRYRRYRLPQGGSLYDLVR